MKSNVESDVSLKMYYLERNRDVLQTNPNFTGSPLIPFKPTSENHFQSLMYTLRSRSSSKPIQKQLKNSDGFSLIPLLKPEIKLRLESQPTKQQYLARRLNHQR
jgi:hypothetical protein